MCSHNHRQISTVQYYISQGIRILLLKVNVYKYYPSVNLIWDRVPPSFFSCLEQLPPSITSSMESFRDILLWHTSVTSFHGILPLHPSEASFRDILYPSTPSYFILFSHLVQRVLNLPFSPTCILIISIHT